MENWKSEISNWKNISNEVVEFFLKQSEEYLEETVKTFENSSKKTNQILAISITVITITLGYFLDFEKKDLELKLTAFLALFLCIIIIIIISKNLFFDKIGVKGSQPKEIIKEKLLPKNLNQKEQYLNIILNECEKYQEKIYKNNEINKKRNIRIKKATYLLLSLPITIILAKIIMLLI